MRRRSLFETEDDKPFLTRLWKRADALRDAGPIKPSALLQIANELGEPLDWRLLEIVAARIGGRDLEHAPLHPALLELCRGLARRRGEAFDLVLDPWARFGTLACALVSTGVAKQVRAATRIADELRFAESIRGALAVTFEHTADATAWLGRQPACDLIVTSPPWGTRSPDASGSAPRQVSHRILIEAARRLRDDGRILAVLPSGFWFDRDADRTRACLRDVGVSPEAALYLPPGSLGNATSLAAYLVVFSRGVHEHLFVAEVDAQQGRTAAVLENLLERRPGPTHALGTLHPSAEFRGYPQLLERQAFLRFEGDHPGEVQNLGSIARSIHRLPRVQEQNRHDSSLLFVAMADPTAKPATRIEQVSGREERWAVIDIDPARAIPEYVARFLDTDFGRAARRCLATGSVIERIRFNDLASIRVHAPPLHDQRQRLALDDRAREIESRIESIRSQLWGHLTNAADIQHALDQIGTDAAREADLETWAESLPFPLASVLRRYRRHADDDERAFGTLLHFFEAFGEFWATILLSALDRAGEVPGDLTQAVRTHLSEHRVHPLEQSTMGTWTLVGGKIAGAFRDRFLKPPSDSGVPLDPLATFATRDHRVLESLLSSDLSRILQDATRMRNDWKGHGGAIGADRARRLHDDALATLAELRGVIAPAFRTLKLVRTGRAEILSGLYRYEADLLQGSNQTFLPTHVELEESIESKVLALVGSDRRALRLLPFVRMGMPKRDENACYFYSRRERSTARYVSYHQEAEAIDLSDAPLDFLERWNQPPPQPDFT